MRIWDTSKGEVISSIESQLVLSLAVSPDGSVVAGGCWPWTKKDMFHGVCIWSIDGQLKRRIDIKEKPVRELRFTDDGGQLAMAASRVYCLDLHSLALREFKGYRHGQSDPLITELRFADADKRLISTSLDHSIKFYNVPRGELEFMLPRGPTPTTTGS